MNEELKLIAPYSQEQVKEALVGLETNDEFIKGVQFMYPKWTKAEIVSKLQACTTCGDFQVQFIEMIIKNSIKDTMNSFEISGLDSVDSTNSLFISNHRDIFLDSALLQNHLWDIGKPFTEISLGDNLMVNETMKAVAKLNNMFTVFRTGEKSKILRNSINLSKYLRHAITQKKVSAWIAQGNGRTKNGDDKTAPGLIKMLLLSGTGYDIKKDVEELNIVVSCISYEYEPCAFEKANELSSLEKYGSYQKEKFENIHSITSGINNYKGNVTLIFQKLDVNKIDFANNRKKDVIAIAKEIDRLIIKNYKLNKTNFMAYDLLYDAKKHTKHYNQKDIEKFEEYLAVTENEDIYHKVLKMYAQPINNKEILLENAFNQ